MARAPKIISWQMGSWSETSVWEVTPFQLMRHFVAIFSSHGVPDSHLMGTRSIYVAVFTAPPFSRWTKPLRGRNQGDLQFVSTGDPSGFQSTSCSLGVCRE